jgi:transposase InsO family protein
MVVNRKRVARIMREDKLLAVRPKHFVRTTDSNHALDIYVNLARRMTLTGIDQLWIADITYIRLQAEFVYLALILDGFSRKVVGWKLDRTLASRLAIEALEIAIASRKPLAGLVHHSDRGIQYASGEYVGILRKHEMVPSMSRPANPYDNASSNTRTWNICAATSKTSSSGTTIGNVCTRLWDTARRRNSSNKPRANARQQHSVPQ